MWAGMSGELDMVDALNVRAGFTPGNYLALQGVLNKLAGTTGRDTNAAAEALLAGRLSAANSGFESGVGDWGVNANCTRAQSSAQAYAGTNSLALTSLAAGDMSVQILPVTLGVPVTPGQMLDASARVCQLGNGYVVRLCRGTRQLQHLQVQRRRHPRGVHQIPVRARRGVRVWSVQTSGIHLW